MISRYFRSVNRFLTLSCFTIQLIYENDDSFGIRGRSFFRNFFFYRYDNFPETKCSYTVV